MLLQQPCPERRAFFLGSESTSYASLTSLNCVPHVNLMRHGTASRVKAAGRTFFSAAALFPGFLSGWCFIASFRYA